MKLYVIQNSDGKYFRPVGTHGGSSQWHDSIEKAKFYTRLGPAQAQVTFYTNQKMQPPKVLCFDLDSITPSIVDMSERIHLAKIDLTKKRIRSLTKTIGFYEKVGSMPKFAESYPKELQELENELISLKIEKHERF